MSQAETSVFEHPDTVGSWDSDYYHPIAERYYDRAVPEMLALMGAKPGDTVLDAGCGPGVHSIRAAKYGLRVKAIDISETMLAEAHRRVAAAGVADQVEFAREDLTRLSFADASFKFVFSWGVIIHIREIEKALDELARIVEPGGRLALYLTNDTAWDHKLESAARFLVRKPLKGLESLPLGHGVWYEMHDERLWVWRVNSTALEAYLKGRGLRRVALRVGEFTEIQRRVKGPFRRLLLRTNNLCHRLRVPAGPAAACLHVFERS